MYSYDFCLRLVHLTFQQYSDPPATVLDAVDTLMTTALCDLEMARGASPDHHVVYVLAGAVSRIVNGYRDLDREPA